MRGAPDWFIYRGGAEVEAETGVYGQLDIAAVPTLILSANRKRQSVTLFNMSDVSVYVGLDNTVSPTSGMEVPSNTYVVLVRYLGDIYGVVSSGTARLAYMSFEF